MIENDLPYNITEKHIPVTARVKWITQHFLYQASPPQSQTGDHSSPSFLVSLQHMNDLSEISNMAPGRTLHALASVPARSRLSWRHQLIWGTSRQVPTACLATKLGSSLKPCKQNDYRGDGRRRRRGGGFQSRRQQSRRSQLCNTTNVRPSHKMRPSPASLLLDAIFPLYPLK